MADREQRLSDVVEAFVAARRRGERQDARALAARHPELGAELLAALEAAALLAELPAPSDAKPPSSIGPCQLVRELGRGGMGVVYEALDNALGRRVALKLLPVELLQSAALRARLRREAELASRISHPGVCAVYAAGFDERVPWIAMQHVSGETLARRIERARAAGEPPAPREIAELLAGVARALQAAHEFGVVHRDVKPANIMVTPEGRPVLLDFGLARAEEAGEMLLTRTGETTGTPAYLSPEIIAGELARPDARCDVYSLGVVLYECLALERPFQAPTHAALYQAILSGVPARPLRGALPRELAVVAATAMERDRARRYASAADLAADLEAWAAGRPIAARPVSLFGRVARWARREPRTASILGLVLLLALALALAGGSLLASRDEVLAALDERRARAVEDAVVEGFQHLFDAEPDAADAAFARAGRRSAARGGARRPRAREPRSRPLRRGARAARERAAARGSRALAARGARRSAGARAALGRRRRARALRGGRAPPARLPRAAPFCEARLRARSAGAAR